MLELRQTCDEFVRGEVKPFSPDSQLGRINPTIGEMMRGERSHLLTASVIPEHTTSNFILGNMVSAMLWAKSKSSENLQILFNTCSNLML